MAMANDGNTADSSLYVGKRFSNYQELLNVLEQRRTEFFERWARDSGGMGVIVANKKIKDVRRHYRTDFVVQYANFKCVHGGIHVSVAKERRKSSRKLGCPCSFQVSANRKENCLIITKYIPEHNHELKFVPVVKQRRRKPVPSRAKSTTTSSPMLPASSTLLNTGDVKNIASEENQMSVSMETELDIKTETQSPSQLTFEIVTDESVTEKEDLPKHLLRKILQECIKRVPSFTLDENPSSSFIVKKVNKNISKTSRMTAVEKRSKAWLMAEELVNVMVNCGQDTFDERCSVLKRLIGDWRVNKDVSNDCGDSNLNFNDHNYNIAEGGELQTSGNSEDVQCTGGLPMTVEVIKEEENNTDEASSSQLTFTVVNDMDSINLVSVSNDPC